MTSPLPHTERGAALLVTLVLVALIAMLTFGAGEITRMQQRLATNDAARQMAFQAAEAALRSAEQAITSTDELSLFCNTGGARYNITTADALESDDHWKSLESQGAAADFTLYDGGGDSFVPTPRYLIGCISPALIDGYEDVDAAVKGQAEENPDKRYFFRVFSIGFGPGGRSVQRLEARYVY
ncbi:pilus assembly PilX family protein [Salinicola rhizosphaerae]|uniref:Type 4 fimbrial biogenesis protein PilX N-terminal domain-containing protein n=1 Tax=Salinicola rhizosphaerae TaxID=1443141 RepID=A0ABQ3EFZ7_9GAMM|nr:PilX N-terminal domain-containing pilus assembly protein [Salinicola rhizosphaerae]GHB33518.1 hypothetical protein GCM10009038_35500 [Salinicola rhizosphaerae]